MPKPSQLDSKLQALKEQGTANTHPEKVTDSLFREKEFFDSRDLIQVKYEMLRRVRMEGASVSEAATAFGLSRPTFYHAMSCFEQSGLAGLLPRHRGPKQAHKLSDEVMTFIDHTLSKEASLRSPALVELVKERFGISVHPRSIEKALAGREKKLRR